jgi:hypothetical protein
MAEPPTGTWTPEELAPATPGQAQPAPVGPPQGTWTPEELTTLVPNPADILSNVPQTWGEWAKRQGGIAARAAIEANPADLPGNVYNVGANLSNRWFGTSAPTVSTPGQRYADYLGLPQPGTAGEHILSGAVGLPASTLMAGPLSGAKYATVLRQAPAMAGVGAAQGAGYDLPPEAQLALGLGAGTAAGEFVPNMRSAAGADRLDLRTQALKEGVSVPSVEVGPPGAKAVYGLTGVPGSGMGAAASRDYAQWADAGARSFGATKPTNGRFTQAVFDDATNAINGLYAKVRTNAPPVPAATGSPFDNAIMGIHSDMTRNATEAQPRVENVIYNLLDQANRNNGTIPGADAVKMLQSNSPLTNLIDSPRTSEELNYAKQVKGALMSATRSAMPSDLQTTWDDANRKYGNLQTYKAAVDNNGIITPTRLGSAANSAWDKGYDSSDASAHAQIGANFITPSKVDGPTRAGINLAGFHGAGAMGIGALGADIAEAMHTGGWISPEAAGIGAAVGWPAAIAANKAFRGLGGGPNPPGAGAYYARLLSQPGLYVGPSAYTQTPSSAPGLLERYGPSMPNWLARTVP